jgi:hypothetical protein
MTPGLIIIDGPDGSGKTTLAKEIVRRTGAHYIHLTYRHKLRMFTYHTAALHRATKLIAQGKLVVIDRLWMSELCYANAYRSGSAWPLMRRFMTRVINKHGAISVVSLPVNTRDHLHAYEQLKLTRQEMYNDILPVVMQYHAMWDRVKHDKTFVRYDYTKDDCFSTDFIDVLLAKVMARRMSQDPRILDPLNYNATGHIEDARFIVVGDQTNPRKRATDWWPFHDYAASSLYLTGMFEECNFDESQFIWTNARGTPEMARQLLGKYDLIPLCLGDRAYKHVAPSGGDYLRFNKPLYFCHPAYDMRFNRGHSTLKSNMASAYYGIEEGRIFGHVFDRGAAKYERDPANDLG